MLRFARRLSVDYLRVAAIRRGRCMPAVEQLEDRLAPATVAPILQDAAVPAINELPDSTLGGPAREITTGPDGNLWFTAANAIGTINPTTHALAGFVVPTVGSGPQGITSGPDGNVWFTEYNANKIGSINPTTHTITEYPLPGGEGPYGITTGPDGNLWFTLPRSKAIGMLSLSTKTFKFQTVAVFGSTASPYNIVAGPDGRVWYTEDSAIGSMDITMHDRPSYFLSGYDGLNASLTVGTDGNIWFTGLNTIGTINPTTLKKTLINLPVTVGYPASITTGPDSNLWFSESASGKIANINPATDQLTEISTTLNGVTLPTEGVAAGPGGEVWFTEAATSGVPSYVASVDPTTQKITAIALPLVPDPAQIATGPDGNLWFTETTANRIGVFSPATQSFLEVAVPTPNASPTGIAAGPDGKIWFTEATADMIGVINVATMAVSEFALSAGSGPSRIVAGPDGNLWFTETKSNRIGTINPTSHAISETSLPTQSAGPLGIASGPDGNVWFTEHAAGAIGRINPGTHAVSEFALGASVSPTGITAGPDGNVWFTETGASALGMISPSTHVISEIAVGDGNDPQEITTGSDGNLWFTIDHAHSIAQFNLAMGTVIEFAGPALSPNYVGITLGSDGKIWIADQVGSLGSIAPPTPTQVALSIYPTNAVVGQLLYLTADVTSASPNGPFPSGNVTFLYGNQVLGIFGLSFDGVNERAQGTCLAPGVGIDRITAVYGGDLLDLPNTATANVTVDQAATTATITPSVSASKYGVPVTFTSIVSATAPGSGTPTGLVQFQDGNTILGTAELQGADSYPVAKFTYTGLGLGSHSIVAVYLGDANYQSSQSPSTNVTVTGPADTTTTIDMNPSVVGQPVTITATVTEVAPSAGVITGAVAFLDGNTVLGYGTLDTLNHATITALPLALGTHKITAVYAGDENNNGSTSAAQTLTVSQDSTTTTLAVPDSPATLGTITLTATVAVLSPGAGIPTGSVRFFDGTHSLGTLPLGTVNGVTTAVLTTSALAVGSHQIAATYDGDANNSGSTSSIASLTVLQATTLSVSASASSLLVKQPVTLTATVAVKSPGTIAPTGAVTFKDGTSTLGTGTLSTSANGVTTAILALSSLPAGNHEISVVYGGDTNDVGGNSPTLNLPVSLDATTTSLAASIESPVFGQSVKFTAAVVVVSPGTIVPSGTVTFLADSKTLGTGMLGMVNGVPTATFTTTALGVGTHTISAAYGGSSDDAASMSADMSFSVAQDATTTTAKSSVSTPVFGQPVTFTATVAVVSPGAITPTGTVTFMDGSSVLGTGPLATLNGVTTASFTTDALGVATHALTAVYAGDSEHSTSTSIPLNLTVAQDATTLTLTPSVGAPVAGQAESFTVRVGVVSPGAGTPTGNVDLMIDGIAVDTSALSTEDGITSTTFTTSALTVGTHTVTAVYEGDVNNLGSTSLARKVSVSANGTTTALVLSNDHAKFGQQETLTATVTAAVSGVGDPTGTVAFNADNQSLGTGTLTTHNGVTTATLVTTSIPLGTHGITAVYGGDGSNQSSTSSAQFVTISRNLTMTAVTADPAVFGQSLTITATVSVVSPGGGAPTGTVNFMADGVTLGTGTLSTANGVTTAGLTTSALGVAMHQLVAVYGGDPNDFGSTSVTLRLSVGQDETTITLTPQTGPLDFGQPFTISGVVNVSSPGAGLPTGTVTFFDGTANLGTTSLATVGGVATAVFQPPTLALGAHAITAVYGGDSTDVVSTSSPMTVTVVKASTTTKLSATSNPLIAGQPETFTATVRPSNAGAGLPSGTVIFKVGTKTLGSATLRSVGGVATATLKSTITTLGASQITAAYAGDLTRAGSSSIPLALRVGQSFTTASLTASATAPVVGQSVTFTALVVPSNPKPGAPAGTITFLDGGTVLGKATLHTANGKTTAVFTTHALVVGAHSITAAYNGNNADLPSTSKSLALKVAKAHSAATIKASPSTGVAGQSETLTATIIVVSPGSGTPTGQVTFKDGTRVLGTANLRTIKGVASASLTTSSLAAGKHSITVVYAGNATIVGSTSSALGLTLNKKQGKDHVSAV